MESENQQLSTMIRVENAENQTTLATRQYQTRTILAKKLFLNRFKRTLGTVSVATQLTGIERTTVYLWRRTDPEFRREMDEAATNMLEIAEDFLKLAALRHYMPSIHFYLSHRHPDYMKKCNHSNTPIKNPYEKLTVEERIQKLKNLLRIYGENV